MTIIRRATSLLALAQLLHGQALPYNPTRILLPMNSTTLYIFESSDQSSGQARLLTVDISKGLQSSQLQTSQAHEALPFLQDGATLPYTPTLNSDGSITVLTGNCTEGSSGAQVWKYTPDTEGEAGKGSWSESRTLGQGLGDESSIAGSNYLAASVAFSDNPKGNDQSVFVFGGMCPYGDSTADTCQQDAVYSSSMLALSPHASKYDIGIVASRGPPISQAGISVTPLTSTYSTNSNGEQVAVQQDFVLLGGHTQSAFINTSQVALFSLPQQSWAFVPVRQPSNAKTDLMTRRSVQEVTPRSGHTAVLSEDGNSIILFGGWVGNTHTPAEPQLAVLELGSGYGGTGDWEWVVPTQSGQGLSSGSGMYGHGATMLPGGVMMVVGGYEISASSLKRVKRQQQSVNTRLLYYNTTSNTWLQSYTPSASLFQITHDNAGPLSETSQKVGLGTGLGIGAALLVTVLAFYFWYSKRLKRAREERERALLSYSSGGTSAEQIDQPFLNTGAFHGQSGDEPALGRFWPTGGMAGSMYPRPPPMQHTTGMWVNVPSPTRGLRKGTGSKGYQYQAAPRFDDKRISQTCGNIHPIAEHENEDDAEAMVGGSERDELSNAEAKLRDLERVLHGEDPFADPAPNPLGSHPVSPMETGTLRRVPTGASGMSIPLSRRPVPYEQGAANWTVEGDPCEGSVEEIGGRTSPSKSDDRTSSTLSERSQRSTTSSSSITRTMSTRTGALMAAAAVAYRQSNYQENSTPEERTHTMSTSGSRNSAFYFRTRARSSTNGSNTHVAANSAGGDADSFMTARSSFAQLQSEGEVLLGGRPPIDRDDPYQRALAASSSTQPSSDAVQNHGDLPGATLPQRRPGWMGSLRRALNVVSMTDRSFSLTSAVEQNRTDPRSSSSSPTKHRSDGLGGAPRRAVSDGGALLRQKRGQKDWSEKEWPPYHDDPEAGDWGEPKLSSEKTQAEDDWDVEGAASSRDFQVMFTVPKSKLRVVNDDMDRASLRSASDGAVSRNGSLKILRREDSLKTLRAMAQGEAPRLPSTEEEEKDELEKDKAA